MKRSIKIAVVILAFTLSIYNIISANYPIGGGCEVSPGVNLSGTHCWVRESHGPAEHQFQFDTFWCTSTCPLGGSNCCYSLEVGRME